MPRHRGPCPWSGGMTRVLAGPLVAIAAMLLVACAPTDDMDERAANDGEAPADVPVCLLGELFVADGPVEVRAAEPADAHEIAALRWQSYEGCERFVIDLRARDGSHAERAGDVRAHVLRDLGVVRITLRDVEHVATGAIDAGFDGPLVTAAFVVREEERQWLYVDLHLGDAAEAFVSTLDEPARVIVDLRPGGPQAPPPPTRGSHVIVLEPRPGGASYPLAVTGYARTFEANVLARLVQAGEAVFEDFTTASAYIDAWGHYSFRIADGPTGQVVLHIGEYSAKDGTWEGVAIGLEMR
jgi:hypothetical protein